MIERDLEQEKALTAIVRNNYNGIMIASMRFGKTPVAIKAIKSLIPKKILWIVPDTFLRDTQLPAEFKKFKALTYLKKTDIICDRSLAKTTGHYDLVIWDEYQGMTDLNSSSFFNGNITYDHILFMTGTHPKKYETLGLLQKFDVPVIYKLSVDEASDKGIVADYNIILHPFELNSTIFNKKSKKGYVSERVKYDRLTWVINRNQDRGDYDSNKFLITNRMHLVYGSITRKEILLSLFNELNSANKRGIIFTPYKKMAEEFSYYYHSTSKDKHYKAFSEEKVDHLALVNKGGVGHTYKNLDYVIMSQSNSDNKGLNSQKWSRSLLPRKDYTADIHVLYAKNTVDEKWVNKSLEKVDPNKITMW